MFKVIRQWWLDFKRAIGLERTPSAIIVLHQAPLHLEKLPKLIRDGETSMAHEFVFSEEELSQPRVLRSTPYPKLKRDAHDHIILQGEWEGSS